MFSFPSMNITITGSARAIKGDIHLLSIGLGIQQAWIYSVIFGAAQLFRASGESVDGQLLFSPVSLIATIAFSLTLLFIGITDQRLLRFYTDRRTIVVAALLACIGTLAIAASYVSLPFLAPQNAMVTFFAGLFMGIGSGLLLSLWGTAFSRHRTDSIIVNSAIGITLGFTLYYLLIHLVPSPVSGVIAALLPLVEIPLLWRHTPISYALRNVKPIFDPFPFNKALFSFQLALTMFLFGFAFGMIRSVSIQMVIPSDDNAIQLLGIIMGGLLSFIVFTLVFTTAKHDYANNMFRIIVPSVAITMLFLLAFINNNAPLFGFLVLISCICFETLMWVAFGVMAQEYLLSPLYLFSIGGGSFTLFSKVGSLMIINASSHAISFPSPLSLPSIIMLALVCLILALAIVPHVHAVCERTRDHRFEPNSTQESAENTLRTEQPFSRKPEAIATNSAALEPATSESVVIASVVQSQGPQGYDSKFDTPRASESKNDFMSESSHNPKTGVAVANHPEQTEKSKTGPSAEPSVNATTSEVTADSPNEASVSSSKASKATPSSQSTSTQSHGHEIAEESSGAAFPATGSSSTTPATVMIAKSTTNGTSNQSTASSPAATDEEPRVGSFRFRCAIIAKRYLLSSREAEILVLLAKGYNAIRIKDDLCVSLSTVKTHINHIYHKLDIHTQQELLRMVDNATERNE